MSIILSKKLKLSRPDVYMHFCPGCKHTHFIYVNHVNKGTDNEANWVFDGNVELPTFLPSIHITYKEPTCSEEEVDRILLLRQKDRSIQYPHVVISVCHYYLRNGVLEFLPDCQHSLRGKHVPLPDYPEIKPYNLYD